MYHFSKVNAEFKLKRLQNGSIGWTIILLAHWKVSNENIKVIHSMAFVQLGYTVEIII